VLAGSAAPADLALYRQVTVSSTAYGPTPAEFAVDGLAETGVRGTGWRAGGPAPQWLTIDLQAPCRVESVVLVFEATISDPPWTPAQGSNPYANTTGWEIMSSCATAFQLEVSTDGTTWSTVYQTTSGTGGVMRIPLAEPVSARWVRMTATQQSNDTPLQVNGFQVYGTCDSPRPSATGWSDWDGHLPAPPPALTTAPDGTAPVESGWALTLDAWAGTDDGGVLSTGSADTTGWVSASVPGTVLASLVEQGHFPDPAEGFNNLRIPEALSRHSWWYRRPFRLPPGFGDGPGRHVWLEFDGINHHAEIWLSGTRVGELTHPFARAGGPIAADQAPASQGQLDSAPSPEECRSPASTSIFLSILWMTSFSSVTSFRSAPTSANSLASFARCFSSGDSGGTFSSALPSRMLTR
jgi:glycosyl hydrolase family 2/F5/8 type C domain-containing protein